MFILVVITTIMSGFLSLLIHELGHVLTAKREGFTFGFFCAGPFKIYADKSKIKLTISKNLYEWSGMAMMSVDDAELLVKSKFLKYLIGGSKLSLVCSLISMIFSFIAFYFHMLEIAVILLIFGVMNLSIFFATAIPLKKRMGLFYTDGRRYLDVKKENNTGICEFAAWKLMNNDLSKNELLLVHEIKDLIRILADAKDDVYILYSYYYSFKNELTSKEEVLKQLDEFKSKTTKNVIRSSVDEMYEEIVND